MAPVFRCPNPECLEALSPSDQYCEVCGQAVRPSPQAMWHQSLDVGAAHAAAGGMVSSNVGSLQHDRETRGPSRTRDHVELSLPGVAGVSDRGLERSRNEDAVRLGHVADPDTVILVVCDGVSSSQSAARASQAGADAALASLMETLEGGERDLEKAMNDAVAAARTAVSAIPYLASAAKDPPSSTFVAAIIADGHITVGWVGDSRAYFVGPAGTWQLSWDDTWAADQVAMGSMSEREAASDPRGRFLTRWLGEDQEDESGPSVRTFEIEWPGLVLLCSDGLWNYLASAERLGEMVMELGEDATPMAIAGSLTHFARAAGGHDNITVAVAAIAGAPNEVSPDIRFGRTVRLPARRGKR
jgi:serine/threonine protein phosphatase PrpC